MLFSSFTYVFLFLPVVACGYFSLSRRGLAAVARLWILAGSLLFYGLLSADSLVLLAASILLNYIIGVVVCDGARPDGRRKGVLLAGICANLAVLGYFKYADFFIDSLNRLVGSAVPELQTVLPLAISFFTFVQIAYLVDSYRGRAGCRSLLEYAAFISFFPYLIAGPIVRFSEIVPGMRALQSRILQKDNVRRGALLFCIGLFKKVVIADTLAMGVAAGFDVAPALGCVEAWVASISYTFQLYFDFSGYTDMAIGSALVLNIRLPENFNSPYRARNVRDFWSRWHMSLTRFLRDYVYIPLGGNRRGDARIYLNIMITLLVCGLWHGAGWNFVFWGFLHGAALVVLRLWQKAGVRLPAWLSIFLTFQFVNICWVFFRARTFGDALKVLSAMFGFGCSGAAVDPLPLGTVVVLSALVLMCRNSTALAREVREKYLTGACVFLITFCCLQMNNFLIYQSAVSDFLYFNF